ncbi:MFS transporter [Nonomuraea sp. SBT364]|uniref:MFS transporter n=1 Tax=Nonomuraea sp. SBT364 TaxID=1580530 RepID=UPI00066C8F8B|nr:MFS transporter [Nonomuraea sp. SBT364]
MSPSYVAVLSHPHAARAFGFALLGRLSYGTVFLSLTLALTATVGSYALAGALLALFGLTTSVLSPVRARLIDRYGPRRALPPMAALYAVLLGCLALLTWRPGVSWGLLAVLCAAAGACAPPLGPVMRTLWSDLLRDRRLLQRAYSLDTVAEELLYITGPLLAGLLAAVVNPAAGVAVSACLVAAGTFALVTSQAMRARPATAAGRGRGRLSGARALIPPVVASAALGLCLGALSLLLVVFAQRQQQPAAVAWVEAALAAGSAVGGLAYGAIVWRASGAARLRMLAAALGLAVAAAGAAPNLFGLAAAAGVIGLFVAPALTTAYLLADELAGPESRTQAGAWVNTAFNAGSSLGTAGAGLVVEGLSLGWCFALAGAPMLLAVLLMMISSTWTAASRSGGRACFRLKA